MSVRTDYGLLHQNARVSEDLDCGTVVCYCELVSDTVCLQEDMFVVCYCETVTERLCLQEEMFTVCYSETERLCLQEDKFVVCYSETV